MINLSAPRILAQATVDPEGEWRGERWRCVTVTGRFQGEPESADQKRHYFISSKSDRLAAQEGIDRFVNELSGTK